MWEEEKKQHDVREGIWSHSAMEEERDRMTSSQNYSVYGTLLKANSKESKQRWEMLSRGRRKSGILFIHSFIHLFIRSTDIYWVSCLCQVLEIQHLGYSYGKNHQKPLLSWNLHSHDGIQIINQQVNAVISDSCKCR